MKLFALYFLLNDFINGNILIKDIGFANKDKCVSDEIVLSDFWQQPCLLRIFKNSS
jgi:hypothetical protein